MIIRFFLIKPGKEFFTFLVNKKDSKHPLLPEIEQKDEVINQMSSQLLQIIENKTGLKFNIISDKEIYRETGEKDNQILYYIGIISTKITKSTTNEPENYQWLHPREVIRIFRKLGKDEIVELAFEWINQGDYSLDFLSNNFDKMR